MRATRDRDLTKTSNWFGEISKKWGHPLTAAPMTSKPATLALRILARRKGRALRKCPACQTISNFSTIRSGLGSVYSSTHYKLEQCSRCCTLATSPVPTQDELESIYAQTYAYQYHAAGQVEKLRRARNLLRRIESRDGVLWDLGAGDGSLLIAARELGFTVAGCEPDLSSVRTANKQLGQKAVELSSAEEFLDQVARKKPDVIVLSHSLEHMLEPGIIIEKIYNCLSPNGTLLIAVPNAERGLSSLLGSNWGYWQVPVHTVHFLGSKFPQLLAEYGFEVTQRYSRSFDFLTLGASFLNILDAKSTSIPKTPGPVLKALILIMSQFWSIFMNFGKSELIVVAKRRQD